MLSNSRLTPLLAGGGYRAHRDAGGGSRPRHQNLTLALPKEVEHSSLATLREKLIQIGSKVVRHGRYITFQLAEVEIPRDLFADIRHSIDRRKATLTPA